MRLCHSIIGMQPTWVTMCSWWKARACPRGSWQRCAWQVGTCETAWACAVMHTSCGSKPGCLQDRSVKHLGSRSARCSTMLTLCCHFLCIMHACFLMHDHTNIGYRELLYEHSSMCSRSCSIQHCLKLCVLPQHLQSAMVPVPENSRVKQHRLLISIHRISEAGR